MGRCLHVYSSTTGMVMSSVLKTHYDPRLPFTTAPPTWYPNSPLSTREEICERVIPVRRGMTFEVEFTSSTRIFHAPDDYYVIAQAVLPPPSPPPGR